MKKTTIYKILVLINYLIFICVGLLMWQIKKPIALKSGWFAMSLIFVGLNLFIKFAIFGSDNIIWFALVLIVMGVYNTVGIYFNLTTKLWPVYVVLPCLVSFSLAVIFKSLWQLCLGISFLFLGAPLFLASFSLMPIWCFIIVYVACLTLGVFCINFVFNLVRGVYGKVWYWKKRLWCRTSWKLY